LATLIALLAGAVAMVAASLFALLFRDAGALGRLLLQTLLGLANLLQPPFHGGQLGRQVRFFPAAPVAGVFFRVLPFGLFQNLPHPLLEPLLPVF
jgi:hypothetical protein